jgi:prolipoprotein diacylglyceryltransferase
MFPFFELIFGIRIYSFGLTIIICFFLFLWMLKKLSTRYDYDDSIFQKNIFWYFISVFIFSRLVYIVWKWNDLKYIRNPLDFFIMSDYNFSLFWAIIGFFIVLAINLRLRKEKLKKYIDGIVISFFFVLFIGLIWAFFGGQIYGRETSFGIEMLYNHPFTSVPFQVPIFPLAIVYSFCFFVVFSALYILSMFVKVKWLLGYLWLIVFSSILLIFEFFSGKYDILKNWTPININQLLSLFLMLFASYKLYEILQTKGQKSILAIIKNGFKK